MLKSTLYLLVFFIMVNFVNSQPIGKENSLLRTISGVYDLQLNSISPIEMFSTNYGINGHYGGRGGILWPRGSHNQYIFAHGIWFGAQKKKSDNSGYTTNVAINYNPNSGKGWFVPGRISDGDKIQNDKLFLYRTYFSTDFYRNNGKTLPSEIGPNWPLWKKNASQNTLLLSKDNFEIDSNKRNSNDYPLGPIFISDEDIFTTYKDTDLSRYEEGEAASKSQGYPLKLQFDQRILTFNSNNILADCAIYQYLITNESTETLNQCYLGGFFDPDLARDSSSSFGAGNDFARYYSQDSSLNLAYCWTNTERKEYGHNFGYVGASLLESPSVDENGNIKDSKNLYPMNDQLGLRTCKIWEIDKDSTFNSNRYNLLSSDEKTNQLGPRDVRMMLSSGPFNLKPGESVRFAYLLSFGLNSTKLVSNVKEAIKYYYDNNTSVDENVSQFNSDLVIAPNPASDFINIALKPSEGSLIEIYNIMGVKILTSLVETKNFSSLQKIDVSNLAPGFYFLKIGDRIEKFVKM